VLDLALIGSAALLGLASTPHCAAMCGAACAAATGAGRAPRQAGAAPAWAFHAARITGYAVAGGVAAGSIGGLATLAQISPALRPLWTLLHIAALALGLWLLWQGRQPGWMARLGKTRRDAPVAAGGWQRIEMPLKAAGAGVLWVAWPCGLLQSALLVSGMANTAWAGAAAMASFATASAGGLVLAPWAWQRWGAGGDAQTLVIRSAGALMAAASAWALGHGLWERFAAFCAAW
jgi:sulfite exporter TauE/SafE